VEVFGGVNALSDFRKAALLRQLQAIDASIVNISAEYLHFVKAVETPRKQLEKLLTYGQPFLSKREGTLFLAVPRPGTISPWSSKATNIAHNAGLNSVKRIERGIAYYVDATKPIKQNSIAKLLHDRMVEAVLSTPEEAEVLFKTTEPKPVQVIDVLGGGQEVLERANEELVLALAPDEIEYLYNSYQNLGRNPTDAELMMFGVVNSEHCRHKIFNADWEIDGKKQPKSLFQMIKNTHEKAGDNVLSAYSDNAAVLKGGKAEHFYPDPSDHTYKTDSKDLHIVIKAETHNHPTAIAPNPGSATGTGGEIRDESSTGRGARSKMGLAGFSVSNLNLPGAKRSWEHESDKPDRIASARNIMIDGPLGAAGYANEFGRPGLAGYFRTYEQEIDGETRGYHKPIMIGGGLGAIRDEQIEKLALPIGAKIIVLGGPAMLIGLGGGSGSSMQTGASREDLDFASVQRANAEIQRRAQEVINACTSLGKDNPILSIHDVGAGGLSNALPELVHNADRGAHFELRDIPNDEPGMSPMEIWCNEAQERFVLAINQSDVEQFQKICERERCPFAVVGEATQEQQLTLHDSKFNNNPIDIPMSLLFGKPPKMTRKFSHQTVGRQPLQTKDISLPDAVERVLKLPAVASKKFLITIGDRTVGGLVARDQMVGRWQVPVSDVAVTSRSYEGVAGEAMAVGERTPLALINAPASARIAIGEAITNIAAAKIEKLSDVKLSANWMAAAGHGNEDQALFDAVHAVGETFCPEIGITIPVGKDSLSMRTIWRDGKTEKSVTAPLSLIISAFAPVINVTETLTPELRSDADTVLILVDLGKGKNRLGGSALAQVYNQLGNDAPDIKAQDLKHFFNSIQKLSAEDKLLAYHDRSDGGLFTTLCEMVFASRMGLNIELDALSGDTLGQFFSEELGAVIQVHKRDQQAVLKELGDHAFVIGIPQKEQKLVISKGGKAIYTNSRSQLEQWWADTSYRLQAMRDNADCAQQEFESMSKDNDPGLHANVPFKLERKQYKSKPKVAILREQGVNGQVEMAAAFDRAGFTAVDVHLQDINKNLSLLEEFVGAAACGGFAHGDVLGAGGGWAKTILFNPQLRSAFQHFFERPDTFSLGVCNGCQMFSALKGIIPGADHWPRFLTNTSERFEARLVMAKVVDSPSVFFRGMADAQLPVPTAHGEGRAMFTTPTDAQQALKDKLVPLQFIDNYGRQTEAYPANPNGSSLGITALTSKDGRATILMPHPERVFLTKQFSWHPLDWGEESPWFKLFLNARNWVADNA
jgi:phosphoribosylformylglycinamidine synthase